MFKAWARDIIWRVVSIWVIIKAVSLDNITKIVSIDRDRSSTRIPGTLMLGSQGAEEEPAKKNEKEEPMRLEENQAMRCPGSQKKKKFQGEEK